MPVPDTSQLNRLEVAFAIDASLRMAQADDHIDFDEMVFLAQTFSKEGLREMGFVGEGGKFTTAFRQACEEAKDRLPADLSAERKLAIADLLHQALQINNAVDPRELVVLFECLASLGLTEQQVNSHLGL